jgi:hypothetical protein
LSEDATWDAKILDTNELSTDDDDDGHDDPVFDEKRVADIALLQSKKLRV